MVKREHCFGIYCYIDKKDDSIVYIGKDSYIHKNQRDMQHKAPSLYNAQPFNQIIQNNLDRYEYKILEKGISDETTLNELEINYIKKYNPKFNFTKGGDGTTGYKHTEEAIQKIINSKRGKPRSDETRRKVSKNNARHWSGKKRPSHSKRMSGENNPRWLPYYRIVKGGILPNGKQNYIIMYNGTKIKQSVNTHKLIKWFKNNHPNDILKIKG